MNGHKPSCFAGGSEFDHWQCIDAGGIEWHKGFAGVTITNKFEGPEDSNAAYIANGGMALSELVELGSQDIS